MMNQDELVTQIYQKLIELSTKLLESGIVANDKFGQAPRQDQLNEMKKLVDRLIEESSNLSSTRDNYSALEKQVQKYESEIRKHIRMEQQIKLYAESLQQKYEESEATRTEMLETTKSMITSVKRENQQLTEQMKTLKIENDQLRLTIKQLRDQERHLEDKQKQINIFQERIKVLEGIGQESKMSSQPINIKVPRQSSQKKVNGVSDLMAKTISEVLEYRQIEKTSGSQTIDNSAFGVSNKGTNYLKVKIEIENSKESQRQKNSSLHYHGSDRPSSIIREKKSQTVHQPAQKPRQYTGDAGSRQYRGDPSKPFMSNPSSINNSIHIVSNYQNLVKSRQSDQRQQVSVGNWTNTNVKKIVGRNKTSNTQNDISKNSKVSQDYSEFLEEYNNQNA